MPRKSRCRRLAVGVGVGNSQFATKLKMIADEYETKAVQAEAGASGKK